MTPPKIRFYARYQRHPRILGGVKVGHDFTALGDPMNQRQPVVTRQFRKQVQKWAMAKGVPIEDCRPAILAEINDICPLEGMSMRDVWGGIINILAKATGAQPNLEDFR